MRTTKTTASEDRSRASGEDRSERGVEQVAPKTTASEDRSRASGEDRSERGVEQVAPKTNSSSATTPELTFRRATQADWSLIWPFFEQVVRAGDTYCYEPDLGSDAACADWFNGCDVFLVQSGDAVLGTYHLAPNRAGPGSHIANTSYMVSEASRGHGVGRAMVVHSMDRARDAGYRGIQFNAVVATNVRAIRLYAELGFEVIGTVPGGFRHPTEGFVDLLIMYRSL